VSAGDRCVCGLDLRCSSEGDYEMISLIRIRQSNLARLVVWLAAAWLFFVVTEIDRFHNHDNLVSHDGCTDLHCHKEPSGDNDQSSAGLILSSHELDEQASDCAACRLWSVLSSIDFVSPQLVQHDADVSRFISSEAIGGPATAVIVCFGRSPPVSS